MTLTTEQRLTLAIVVVITVAVLVWDYILMRDSVPGNTISAALRACSECLPIPLVCGIWMAHAWWYLPGEPNHVWCRLAGFLLLTLLAYGWWEFSDDAGRTWLSARPAITFQLGFLAGHWLWPQFAGAIGS